MKQNQSNTWAEAEALSRWLTIIEPSLSLKPQGDGFFEIGGDAPVGSVHIIHTVAGEAQPHSPIVCLAGAVDRLARAARSVPTGRHVLWLRVKHNDHSASASDEIVMAAAMLGAIAYSTCPQFIGGVYDSGIVSAAARFVASQLTCRLPLANGSFIEAEAWAEWQSTEGRPAPSDCAWRFVPAAGHRIPRLEPSDAKILERSYQDIHRPAIAQLFRGERIPRAAFDAIDNGSILDMLNRSGLIEPVSTHVTSGLRWTTHDGIQVISDADVPDALQGPAYLDPLWEAPTLCRLFPDVPMETALEVGCGAGLISLRLATIAARVTATDINPRALAMSRLNCAINGVDDVAFVQGDLLERILDAQYDAVVFSSPTDREGLTAQSLLLAGENILDRFLLQLPSVLSPKGWCVVNLAVNEATFGNVLDRAVAAFGADFARRDIAFVQTERCRSDESWSRGLLLAAPGGGRQISCILDYYNAKRPLHIEGDLCLDSWLEAISKIVS